MELTTFSDGELANAPVGSLWEHLVALQRFRNRLDAYEARVLSVAERRSAAEHGGERRMGPALARQAGVSRGEAARRVGTAQALVQRPHIAEVLGQGDITSAQARAVADARVSDEVREQLLADAIAQTTDQTVEAVARAERSGADGDQRFVRQRQMRTAIRFCDRDGMWNLRVRLDPEAGASVDTALTAEYERIWHEEKTSRQLDGRTPDQRLADALTHLTTRDPSPTGPDASDAPGSRVVLNVTVDHAGLLQQVEAEGLVDNGIVLAASTVRRLACDAEVLPIVMGGPSRCLDLGRSRRTASSDQRRALVARDRGCVRCGAPPSRCHVHHLHHWGRGGATNLDDLALLCHDCHIWVHEGGHTLQRQPDGTWTTIPSAVDDVGAAPEPHRRE